MKEVITPMLVDDAVHEHVHANPDAHIVLEEHHHEKKFGSNYEPAKDTHGIIRAACESIEGVNNSGLLGIIEFAQIKDYETQVKGTFMMPASTTYRIVIQETGILGAECATAAASDEFTPWAIKDPHTGKWKSEEAMEAGRIQDVTPPAGEQIFMFVQEHVEQNLEGDHGLIGKSLTFYDNMGTADDTADDTLIGCCLIARVETEHLEPTNIPTAKGKNGHHSHDVAPQKPRYYIDHYVW